MIVLEALRGPKCIVVGKLCILTMKLFIYFAGAVGIAHTEKVKKMFS